MYLFYHMCHKNVISLGLKGYDVHTLHDVVAKEYGIDMSYVLVPVRYVISLGL